MRSKDALSRVIFAGTSDFAVVALEALIHFGYEIVAVYCQPDRPKGRGHVLSACPIKICASKHRLDIYQPESLKNTVVQTQIANLQAEVMIVVAYGQILPIEILKIPKYGCLNIHASLLPRWRGAAPIQRAILAGDDETGVNIIKINEGLDTGDILLEKKCVIDPKDTAQTLHDKLSTIGSQAIIETLNNINRLSLSPIIQDNTQATYAKKLSKNEAWIDWHQSAVQINQQIRAFNPYPITQSNASSDKFECKTLRILSASILNKAHSNQPGEIINHTKGECLVATGDGVLSLQTVQLAGKKVLNIKDFTNANSLIRLF